MRSRSRCRCWAMPALLLALQLAVRTFAAAPPPSSGGSQAAAAASPPFNSSSRSSAAAFEPPRNGSRTGGGAQRSPVAALLRDLPAVKAAVIGACAASAGLIGCLLLRVLRYAELQLLRKEPIFLPRAQELEQDEAEEVETAISLHSRSGRKIKKTRKYDIITTPAERVEMAPLNEDEDDDEDSTVFDIKYR